MSSKSVIAIDAMGGDFGPAVVVPGALQAARECGAKVLLVGVECAVRDALAALPAAERDDAMISSSLYSLRRALSICAGFSSLHLDCRSAQQA